MILGSFNGGQFLSISGTGFDQNPGQTKVFVGDNACDIQEISSMKLTCLTPPKTNLDTIEPSTRFEPGNAGLKYELWLNSDNLAYEDSETWDILLGISPNHSILLDQGAIIRNPIFNETNDYVARMSGFIVAPYDGEFQFYISSSDKVSLYISSSTDVNDTQLIAKSNKANTQVGLSRKNSGFLDTEYISFNYRQ